MKPGDPILFVAPWSSFRGMRGRVVKTTPHLMVVMDGDTYPIRVGEREVVPVADSQQNLTGAE